MNVRHTVNCMSCCIYTLSGSSFCMHTLCTLLIRPRVLVHSTIINLVKCYSLLIVYSLVPRILQHPGNEAIYTISSLDTRFFLPLVCTNKW